MCARFRDEATDDRAVVARAAARGVRTEALSEHHRDQPPRPGLAIGFAGIEAEEIPGAMARLVSAVRGQST